MDKHLSSSSSSSSLGGEKNQVKEGRKEGGQDNGPWREVVSAAAAPQEEKGKKVKGWMNGVCYARDS